VKGGTTGTKRQNNRLDSRKYNEINVRSQKNRPRTPSSVRLRMCGALNFLHDRNNYDRYKVLTISLLKEKKVLDYIIQVPYYFSFNLLIEAVKQIDYMAIINYNITNSLSCQN